MTDRLPDADHAVDDQKRRARRRLVGAVVLALAAAVILPMLLEKEPQPLGEDVSVQIPPVDEGKFVNRLTRSRPGETAAKADPKGSGPAAKSGTPTPEAAKAAAPEAPAPIPAAEGAAAAAPPAVAVESPPPASPSKSIAAAEQRVLAGPPPKSTPAADAKAGPPAKPAQATPAPVAAAAPALAADANAGPSESFAVQLAAFSDDKGANALAGTLKKAGHATAYVEAVDTGHGKLWRVRVGGFTTRADADAARTKLKSEGFNGMVVPVR